jgi:hypothetical protein
MKIKNKYNKVFHDNTNILQVKNNISISQTNNEIGFNYFQTMRIS